MFCPFLRYPIGAVPGCTKHSRHGWPNRRTRPEAAAPQTCLMDLPDAVLCLIYKAARKADRKSLCCAIRAIRASCLDTAAIISTVWLTSLLLVAMHVDISALIKCSVDLEPDGSATAATLLQSWPSFAPPPQRLLKLWLNQRSQDVG